MQQTFTEKFFYLLYQPGPAAIYFLTFIGLSVLYFFSIRYNRPKPKEVFLPVFRPPFGLSPAAVRYIYSMGFDTKCLVAAMMNAAIKGCYKLRWANKGFIAFLNPEGDSRMLSHEEFLAFTIGNNKFREKITFSSRISFQNLKMSLSLDRYLTSHFGKLIDKRMEIFRGGIIISSVAMFLSLGIAGGTEVLSMFFLYYLITWTCILVPVILLSISLRDKYWFGLVVCCVYLAGGLLGLITIETRPGMPYFFPVVLPFIGMHIFVYRRLPSPTRTGQKVLDEIMAYRKFLAADFAKINSMEEMKAEQLKAIPYVVALDVETRFTPFFNDLLTTSQYSPYSSLDRGFS